MRSRAATSSAFHWIGGKGFSGDAGEHASSISAPTSRSSDTDGDSQADLAVLLHDFDGSAQANTCS